MPNPFDQFDGAPQSVTLGAPDPYKQRDQQIQEESNRRAEDAAARAQQQFDYQRQRDAQQDAKINQKEIPAGAASGIQANIESLRAVDDALSALKGRPESIGPGTGALTDTFTQFNDPGGTDVRAGVGNIGAIKIHDLSGAAVSPTEAPRFQPFVPSVTDRPEVAQKKLQKFREGLVAQIKESLDYYTPTNGYRAYQTPQAQQFLQGLQPQQQEHPAPQKLSPEQQQKFFSVLQSQGPDAADAYLRQFGLALKSKEAAAKPHSNQIEYPAVQGLAEGLGGVAEAVGDTLGIISNPFLMGVNALAGTNYNPDMGANLRNALGLPEASTPAQQFVNSAGGAALAGGAMGGLARVAAPAFSGVMGNALAQFGASPGADAIMSGTSGAGADLARQAGGGPGAQLAAGLAGGIAGAPLASRLSSAAVRSARPQTPPLVDSATGRLNEPLEAAGGAGRVQAAQEFGIDLPMGSAGDRTASIIEKGLDNLPGSAGVMNDARRAVEGQVQNAADDVAGKFGSSRTLNEGGSELQQSAKDWMTRFDDVTSKAYDAIPISPKAPATLNNTKATLEQLSGRLESNPELQEEIRDPKLLRFLDAINKNGLDWQGMKEFRTYIGNKVGQFRFSEDARTGDYRALYAALSEDMRASASAQGPQALRAFERANGLKAQGEQRIEQALSRILGPDAQKNPEAAAAAVQAMTKGGKSTGDLKMLAQIRAATVKSGGWDEIAATLIRIGGQPANSLGRAFDPAVFVRWYSDMAEPARGMLFKPELRKTLDQFVAVNQRLAGSNALRNTSNTVPGMFGGGALLTAGAAFLNPLLGLKLAGTMAANYGMSKLWTSPKFVQWATGYSRAVSTGNENAVRSQVGRLSKLATTNPELRSPIESLLKSIANDNAVPAVAASTDVEGENQ